MRVGLLNTKPTVRANFLLRSVEQGIRAAGDDTLWLDDYQNYHGKLDKIDVAVQVCFPNKHKSEDPKLQAIGQFRLDINKAMVARGLRALTIDTGFIRNQSQYELQLSAKSRTNPVIFDPDNLQLMEQSLQDIYYEIGYDGLKRHADYCNTDSPPDRWQLLGVPLLPWRKTGKHILLLGQTLKGQSSQHIDIYQWYAEIARKIRAHSGREIVFRHHPRISKTRPEAGNRSRVPKDRQAVVNVLGNSFPGFTWHRHWLLQDDLKDCWACVAFTTNAIVEAVVAGVPSFSLDSGCIAWPVTGHDVAQMEAPPMPVREQWAYDLAYAQWNVAEMRSGAVWNHFRPHAVKPRSSAWGVTSFD